MFLAADNSASAAIQYTYTGDPNKWAITEFEELKATEFFLRCLKFPGLGPETSKIYLTDQAWCTCRFTCNAAGLDPVSGGISELSFHHSSDVFDSDGGGGGGGVVPPLPESWASETAQLLDLRYMTYKARRAAHAGGDQAPQGGPTARRSGRRSRRTRSAANGLARAPPGNRGPAAREGSCTLVRPRPLWRWWRRPTCHGAPEQCKQLKEWAGWKSFHSPVATIHS